MDSLAQQDRWHELLTTRYVCDVCLTRFFVPYRRCPACRRFGQIRALPFKVNEDWRRRMVMGRMGLGNSAQDAKGKIQT
jgi:hypothetical protein